MLPVEPNPRNTYRPKADAGKARPPCSHWAKLQQALALLDCKVLNHIVLGGRSAVSFVERRSAIDDGKNRRILLRLMGKSLDDAIAFIEDLSGEKLTPEEIGELRSIMCDDDHQLNS